jgi:small-conductance mechanosensitive channel
VLYFAISLRFYPIIFHATLRIQGFTDANLITTKPLLILLFLQVIISVFRMNWPSIIDTIAFVLHYPLLQVKDYQLTLVNILLLLVIYIVARLMVRVMKRLIQRRFSGQDHLHGKVFTLSQIGKYFIYTVAILAGMRAVGVDLTLVLAGSTALLVGVGFGLQHIFNDFASGLVLLFEGDLQVNDVVEIDNLTGKVIEIGLRTSKILTPDNYLIVVPNSKFVANNVINWSHQQTATRFAVKVGVAYGTDLRLASEVLLQCALQHASILDDPAPFVRLNDFGNSSLDLALLFWTNDIFMIDNVKSDLRFAIENAFRQQGIVIPFPQQDIHIKRMD